MSGTLTPIFGEKFKDGIIGKIIDIVVVFGNYCINNHFIRFGSSGNVKTYFKRITYKGWLIITDSCISYMVYDFRLERFLEDLKKE